jgi:hypothetical protein
VFWTKRLRLKLFRKVTTAINTTMKTSIVFLTLFSPLLVLGAVDAQSVGVSEQPDKLSNGVPSVLDVAGRRLKKGGSSPDGKGKGGTASSSADSKGKGGKGASGSTKSTKSSKSRKSAKDPKSEKHPKATNAPAPVGAPVVAPVVAPIPSPVVAPVVAPVPSPVVAPVVAPVPSPVVAPVIAPVPSPEVAPVPSPVIAPVSSPTVPTMEVVGVEYSIAVSDHMGVDMMELATEIETDLVAAMDILAPEIVAEILAPGGRFLQSNVLTLRNQRRLNAVVQLPTAIESLIMMGTWRVG